MVESHWPHAVAMAITCAILYPPDGLLCGLVYLGICRLAVEDGRTYYVSASVLAAVTLLIERASHQLSPAVLIAWGGWFMGCSTVFLVGRYVRPPQGWMGRADVWMIPVYGMWVDLPVFILLQVTAVMAITMPPYTRRIPLLYFAGPVAIALHGGYG
jgi:Flp pilus assembly protein protease CpaA